MRLQNQIDKLNNRNEQSKSDLQIEIDKMKEVKTNLLKEIEQLKVEKANLLKEINQMKGENSNTKETDANSISKPKSIREKEIINIAVIGQVDAGKSTIIGHLLCDSGFYDMDQFNQIENEAEKVNKGSLKYAFVMDKQKEEREKEMTINISHSFFETSKYFFDVIDTPGHVDYITTAIRGASQIDTALLVIDSTEGSFEEGISEYGQTREKASLAFTNGAKQIIVAVNKMDDKTVKFSKDRFDKIKNELSRILMYIGFRSDQCIFVPISGLFGDNMTSLSSNFPWWKDFTLVEAFDNLVPPKRPFNKPLRIPIHDIYDDANGAGTFVTGQIEAGTLKTGQNIKFALSKIEANVKSIELLGNQITEALPYNIVRFKIDTPLSSILDGDVCGEVGKDCPLECTSFTAQMIIYNISGKIIAGYRPLFCCHTACVPCKFAKLVQRIDRRYGKKVTENPEWIQKDDAAVVIIEPLKPIIVETFKEYPALGRFILLDMKQIIAAGVIRSIEKS